MRELLPTILHRFLSWVLMLVCLASSMMEVPSPHSMLGSCLSSSHRTTAERTSRARRWLGMLFNCSRFVREHRHDVTDEVKDVTWTGPIDGCTTHCASPRERDL
ncbi:hypothetical protein BT93_F2747 [Corymbia citriodora subsp. variegata]|nr:hypothetical protein BT93_F2747 [Corymbia citriodora subsp. variegata]